MSKVWWTRLSIHHPPLEAMWKKLWWRTLISWCGTLEAKSPCDPLGTPTTPTPRWGHVFFLENVSAGERNSSASVSFCGAAAGVFVRRAGGQRAGAAQVRGQGFTKGTIWEERLGGGANRPGAADVHENFKQSSAWSSTGVTQTLVVIRGYLAKCTFTFCQICTDWSAKVN